jgi:hypothetical protein
VAGQVTHVEGRDPAAALQPVGPAEREEGVWLGMASKTRSCCNPRQNSCQCNSICMCCTATFLPLFSPSWLRLHSNNQRQHAGV